MNARRFGLSFKDVVFEIRLQLGYLVFIGIVYILGYFVHALSPKGLQESIEAFVSSHGVWSVGAVSFVENVGGANMIFPGSIAILTTMAATSGQPAKAVLVFLLIVVPSFVAQQLNYGIGRFFPRHRSVEYARARRRFVDQRGLLVTFLGTLWHPHFTALTATAAGAEGIAYHRFLGYFVPIFLGWNLFWAVAMYSLGSFLVAGDGMLGLVLLYLLGWASWDIWKLRRARLSGESEP